MPDVSPPSYLCPVTIGRSAEIERLRGFLDERGGALLISGEAGIGKTRLVREARAMADAAGMAVLEGRSYETDRALPFAPAIDLLRNLIDRLGVAETARLAGPAAAPLSRLLPELTPPAGAANAAAVDPETAKRRLLDGITRPVIGLAADQPLLLIFEDIHWPDSSSLELLLHLVRRAAGDPIFLVLTYRSDEVHGDLEHLLATLDRERLATEISLDRLDAGQVATMMQATLGAAEHAPATLLHAMYALTEGNPFFIEEVLSTLGAERPFISAAGTWLRSDAVQPRIPRSVHDAVRRRIDGLSATARGVLILAAVAGRRFAFDLLGTLCDLTEAELLDIMSELAAAQLVVEESGDRFAFRHALTREAIYAGLLARERRRLHRRIADALVQVHGTESDAHLDDLARHTFAAASWTRALDACRRAGARAAALHAPRAAAEHFTHAITAATAMGLAPASELSRARGRAYETLGEFEHALADHQAALDAARASGARRDEWQILLDLALLWASRDYGPMGQFAQQALAAARELDDASALAHSLNRVGNWLLNVEEPDQATRFHREALEIFEDLGNLQGVAETLDLLGLAGMMCGDTAAGTAAYTRAKPLWRALGDQRGLASALIGIGMQSHSFHDMTHPAPGADQASRDACSEGIALCQHIGWRAGEAWALWACQGMTLGANGEYDVALPASHQALQIAREIEHHQWIVAARCMIGNIHADLGDASTARIELQEALALARQIRSPYWIHSGAGWLGSVLVRSGELDRAIALLEVEHSQATPLNTIAGRLLWLAEADLALAQGQGERALEIVERLAETAAAGYQRPAARLELLRGAALMALGQIPAARAALLVAHESAVWSRALPLLWRIDAKLGDVHLQLGHREAAASALANAWSLVEEMAARVPAASLQASLHRHAETVLPAGSRPAARPPHPAATPASPLTPRETEVAAMLTKGLTNREIGNRLFLSEWTVATHVRNILAKLDLSSRTQVAAWAVSHGLTGKQ